MSRKFLLIFGTRPEAIKLAPVLFALRANPENECVVCVTGQHQELLESVLSFFDIVPHHHLQAMLNDQQPGKLTARLLPALETICRSDRPDWVLVQGDTTSALAGAMAACNSGLRVAHVEAGVRSGVKHDPYPEEMNRKLITVMADVHFAPTQTERQALLSEGHPADRIHVTGNTGIDAMRLAMAQSSRNGHSLPQTIVPELGKCLILVTVHRRENQGQPLQSICEAIRFLAERYTDRAQFVFPVHPNPNVALPVRHMLRDIENVKLIAPLAYGELISVARACHFAMTDSGGLQEELPSLGKPILILRNVTDRPAVLTAGVARLVGTQKSSIINAFDELMQREHVYISMSKKIDLFGDGHAATRISHIMSGL